MTVASTVRKQTFTLDGVTAAFDFTFRALVGSPTDIKAISTTSGTDTILVYTTNYTVSVDADGVGGTLTLVSPSATGSGTLTVYRETTNTQGSDYDNYNQFDADTLETDLDIRTLISQEQAEESGRTLQLGIAVTGVSATLPTPAADEYLAWNSAATAIVNKTFVAADSVVVTSQANAEAGTNNTEFMTPLRDRQAQAAYNLVLDSAVNYAKAADIASATTMDIGAATGNFVDITGTVTTTALGTVQAGTTRKLRFITAGQILTHNATSLILPGGANITTAANDIAEFVSLGSGNWLCTNYQRASGLGVWEFVSTTTFSSTASVEVTGLATGYDYTFSFRNTLPATDTVSLLMQTSDDGGSTYDSAWGDYITSGGTYTSLKIVGVMGNVAGEGCTTDVTIPNPRASAHTHVWSIGMYFFDNGFRNYTQEGGKRDAVESVDAVKFFMESGNIASGVMNVYRRKLS
jgi:hypothetical protein